MNDIGANALVGPIDAATLQTPGAIEEGGITPYDLSRSAGASRQSR
jgi:hypothetical protein